MCRVNSRDNCVQNEDDVFGKDNIDDSVLLILSALLLTS